MDVILGNRPEGASQLQHEDDAVGRAFDLYEAAMGPARRRVYDLKDGRSLELYWEAEAQAARSRTAAGGGAQHVPVPVYHVSAERSTATWAGDEDAGSPPSGDRSSPCHWERRST